ncbi:lactase-like protein [Sorex araneus]|uniref:lactase-like protein n=1 Tax=Sorex araneus TaxID=42254 RepID=UPI0024335D18|nr:lactase-like protein [Sorex araneus]
MKPELGTPLWGLLLLLLVCRQGASRVGPPEDTFFYGTFPRGFSWGVGSSAFPTEGAWDQDGKGPSIWDDFTRRKAGSPPGHGQAQGPGDGYKAQEDVGLLRSLGVSHYRFSVSWPRLLPTGVRAEQVNEKGVRLYSDLIDTLLRDNITPIVTLNHWDLPQALQARFSGWQNVSMAAYFRDFADLCFEAFGDRVKYWITFSDPVTMVEKGYETGVHAPGLKLPGTGLYQAAHHIIKAHARAWHSYNSTWRSKQRGLVGISLNCAWGEPLDISDPKDVEAAERYLQFCLGWFANPIYAGDYPQVMKDQIGRKSAEQGLDTSRLPRFSRQEKSFIRGSSDFLSLGHLATRYITARSLPSRLGPSYRNDRDLVELADPVGPELGSTRLHSAPWGLRRLLNFAQTQYGDPPIYVTENGAPQKFYGTQLCDEQRIHYLKGHINEMLKARKDGVSVEGYTAWPLLDTWEWGEGLSERYGFFYVDLNDRNTPRYPRASVEFYRRIMAASGFPSPREVESWHAKALETCFVSTQMLAAEAVRGPMQMVTEVVVPTVCALCVLLAAVLLVLLLRRHG